MGVRPLLTKPLYDLYKSKSRSYVRTLWIFKSYDWLLYKIVAKAVTKKQLFQHDMDTLWEFIKKMSPKFFF